MSRILSENTDSTCRAASAWDTNINKVNAVTQQQQQQQQQSQISVHGAKARTFLGRGRQSEENISRAKKTLSRRFLYYSSLMEKRNFGM